MTRRPRVSMQAMDTKYASRQRLEGDVHDRHELEERRTIKSIRLSVVEEWRWSALSLAFGQPSFGMSIAHG